MFLVSVLATYHKILYFFSENGHGKDAWYFFCPVSCASNRSLEMPGGAVVPAERLNIARIILKRICLTGLQ